MATTVTFSRRQIPQRLSGGYKKTIATVNWDTYATGGFDFTTASYKLGTIVGIIVTGINGATTWDFIGDLTNSTLMAFVRATGAEVADAFDLSTVDTVVTLIHH